MITKISCPACGSKGHITALGTDCTYCGGSKRVPLVPYLRLIGHTVEAANAEHFQKRVGKHHSKHASGKRQQNGLAVETH